MIVRVWGALSSDILKRHSGSHDSKQWAEDEDRLSSLVVRDSQWLHQCLSKLAVTQFPHNPNLGRTKSTSMLSPQITTSSVSQARCSQRKRFTCPIHIVCKTPLCFCFFRALPEHSWSKDVPSKASTTWIFEKPNSLKSFSDCFLRTGCLFRFINSTGISKFIRAAFAIATMGVFQYFFRLRYSAVFHSCISIEKLQLFLQLDMSVAAQNSVKSFKPKCTVSWILRFIQLVLTLANDAFIKSICTESIFQLWRISWMLNPLQDLVERFFVMFYLLSSSPFCFVNEFHEVSFKRNIATMCVHDKNLATKTDCQSFIRNCTAWRSRVYQTNGYPRKKIFYGIFCNVAGNAKKQNIISLEVLCHSQTSGVIDVSNFQPSATKLPHVWTPEMVLPSRDSRSN